MPLEVADAAVQVKELRTLLRDVLPRPDSPLTLLLPLLPARPPGLLSDKARAQLSSMGLHLGDKVVIAGQKVLHKFCISLSM